MFFERIIEWDWPDAPIRNPIIDGDIPPRPNRCPSSSTIATPPRSWPLPVPPATRATGSLSKSSPAPVYGPANCATSTSPPASARSPTTGSEAPAHDRLTTSHTGPAPPIPPHGRGSSSRSSPVASHDDAGSVNQSFSTVSWSTALFSAVTPGCLSSWAWAITHG